MPTFPQNTKIDFFLLCFLLFFGILHLAFSTYKDKRFTVSCDMESSPTTCIVQFINGQKTKLFYFMDRGLQHYICICPTMQNGDKEQSQWICHLDRDEVHAGFINRQTKVLVSEYARVKELHSSSAIYSQIDGKIEAITYIHKFEERGFLIWHQPSRGGCTAVPTYPKNMDTMKNLLILDWNNWQLKAMPIHACPLKKGTEAFGCDDQQLFIINHEGDILSMPIPTLLHKVGQRFWMSKPAGILHYESWSPEHISSKGPIVEGVRDFFKSPNDAAHKCSSYEHDFVPMQPFAGFEQSMWTATKDTFRAVEKKYEGSQRDNCIWHCICIVCAWLCWLLYKTLM